MDHGFGPGPRISPNGSQNGTGGLARTEEKERPSPSPSTQTKTDDFVSTYAKEIKEKVLVSKCLSEFMGP